MKKGIIFDVDGTLWDSSEVVADSWNQYLDLYAPDVSRRITGKDMAGVMGLTMDQIGEAFFGDLAPARRREVTEACCVYEVEYMQTHGAEGYPGVRETLERLSKDYHIYIVSNCQSGYIETLIKWVELQDLVEDKECFGDTGRLKAYNIRLLADRNGLDQAIYVGDTQGDHDSAAEAGVAFVFATYGLGSVKEQVPAIGSITELPDLLVQIF